MYWAFVCPSHNGGTCLLRSLSRRALLRCTCRIMQAGHQADLGLYCREALILMLLTHTVL